MRRRPLACSDWTLHGHLSGRLEIKRRDLRDGGGRHRRRSCLRHSNLRCLRLNLTLVLRLCERLHLRLRGVFLCGCSEARLRGTDRLRGRLGRCSGRCVGIGSSRDSAAAAAPTPSAASAPSAPATAHREHGGLCLSLHLLETVMRPSIRRRVGLRRGCRDKSRAAAPASATSAAAPPASSAHCGSSIVVHKEAPFGWHVCRIVEALAIGREACGSCSRSRGGSRSGSWRCHP